MKEEDRAKSKADEVKTKRWESDILRRELALPFLKEAYFSDKKAIQEAMETVKGIAPRHLKDNDDVLLCPAEDLIQRLTKTFECYKKSVFEFVEALSEGCGSKDKIDERADMAMIKNEQDEFARQTTCLRKNVNNR